MTALLAGLGSLLTVLVALAGFVLHAEYKDWGRRLARLLVAVASGALAEPERSRRREEWEAELAAVWRETDKQCTGLMFAFCLAARYAAPGWAGSAWRMLAGVRMLFSVRTLSWLAMAVSAPFIGASVTTLRPDGWGVLGGAAAIGLCATLVRAALNGSFGATKRASASSPDEKPGET